MDIDDDDIKRIADIFASAIWRKAIYYLLMVFVVIPIVIFVVVFLFFPIVFS